MQLIPASGGEPTITATTVEAGFYQLLELIQQAESDTESNFSNEDRVNLRTDLNSLQYSGTVAFDCLSIINDDGRVCLNPLDYLSISSWSPGDNSGTLKSQTWSGQLLELATLLITSQSTTARNPAQVEWLEVDYDLKTSTFSIVIRTLPLEREKTSDGWAYKGKEVM